MAQLESSQTPVTALSSHRGLLLAADGPFLRVYDRIKNTPFESHRIFRSQQIHGIAISDSQALSEQAIIWGGKLLRVVNISGHVSSTLTSTERDKTAFEHPGTVFESPDWILHVGIRPVGKRSKLSQAITAVAITAHNDLLALDDSGGIRTLAAGSQCILYSAHLIWTSLDTLLIGSGTAFGEIVVWTYSWEASGPVARIRHVFTGHEGSIFGIRISEPLKNSADQELRVLSTCSDDRTVRVWDISDLTEQIKENDRFSHDTGFSPSPMTSMNQLHNHLCLASAMGHASRIWSLRYIYPPANLCEKAPVVKIVSVGEDATCQAWDLVQIKARSTHKSVGYELKHTDSMLCHIGKNIWSIHVPNQTTGLDYAEVITGGADGRIVTRRVRANDWKGALATSQEWDSRDVARNLRQSRYQDSNVSKHRSGARSPRGDDRECFRGFTFVKHNQILTILNSGLVCLSSPQHEDTLEQNLSTWQSLGEFADLRGYSVAAATQDGSFAFFAGASGGVYCFDHQAGTISQVSKIDGKVAAIFAASSLQRANYCVSLVVACLGRNQAQVVLLRRDTSGRLENSHEYVIESGTSHVTSAAVIGDQNILILGCRNGNIVVFGAPNPKTKNHPDGTSFSLKHVIEFAHGMETVTEIQWFPGDPKDEKVLGSIFSVGRDGTCCVHVLTENLEPSLIHKLSLPFGPNIEGLWINSVTSELYVYGFQGTRFLVYNITALQEVVSINCGGAHRAWTFRPSMNSSNPRRVGGSFAWVQASKLKTSFTSEPSYQILQSGGHGREIKTCAVAPVALPGSTTGPLVATGAEDTAIRLFKYSNDDTKRFTCVATLKKHDTGVQNLKWSGDGNYLFSSGGNQEFFIWRLGVVAILGVGVVCEAVCPVEKGQLELRITAFEVESLTAVGHSNGARADFLITLAYCNSEIKTLRYTSLRGGGHWTVLATGRYTSACLTQAAYLSVKNRAFLLTTSTDGHLAIWDMPELHNRTVNANDGEEQANPSPKGRQSVLRVKNVHQSSIKSCSMVKLADNAFLVCTGGDDNAIGLSMIRFEEDESGEVSSLGIEAAFVPNSHAAAIGAIVMVLCRHDDDGSENRGGYDLKVVSSGNDQRVKLWGIHLNSHSEGMAGVEFQRVSNEHTAVADISDLGIISGTDSFDGMSVVICGVGMETWRTRGRHICSGRSAKCTSGASKNRA